MSGVDEPHGDFHPHKKLKKTEDDKEDEDLKNLKDVDEDDDFYEQGTEDEESDEEEDPYEAKLDSTDDDDDDKFEWEDRAKNIASKEQQCDAAADGCASANHRVLAHLMDNDDDVGEIEAYYRYKYAEPSAPSRALARTVGGPTKQSLHLNVQTPNLWMVACQVGEEKNAVLRLMRKYAATASSAGKLKIKSVVAVEGVEGHVYVEAFEKAHVVWAIQGINILVAGMKNQQMVPIKEMTDVLRVVRNGSCLGHGDFVKVCKGHSPLSVRVIAPLDDLPIVSWDPDTGDDLPLLVGRESVSQLSSSTKIITPAVIPSGSTYGPEHIRFDNATKKMVAGQWYREVLRVVNGVEKGFLVPVPTGDVPENERLVAERAQLDADSMSVLTHESYSPNESLDQNGQTTLPFSTTERLRSSSSSSESAGHNYRLVRNASVLPVLPTLASPLPPRSPAVIGVYTSAFLAEPRGSFKSYTEKWIRRFFVKSDDDSFSRVVYTFYCRFLESEKYGIPKNMNKVVCGAMKTVHCVKQSQNGQGSGPENRSFKCLSLKNEKAKRTFEEVMGVEHWRIISYKWRLYDPEA